MSKSVYQDLKEQTWKANREIPARNLAIYTWGNVSALDAARGVFAIKPSGVPYDELKVEDIVVLDLEGKKVEGSLNPSSDTPTHLVLYRSFPGIGGITHTHSPHATAWAQAAKSIPLFGTTHADHSAHEIPCTDFISAAAVENDYEGETGTLIVNTIKKLYPEKLAHAVEIPMILTAGHGPFAWGETAEKSVYNAAVLEEIARMAWMTLQINPQAKSLPQYITDKHYNRKHGKNAYYGQSRH